MSFRGKVWTIIAFALAAFWWFAMTGTVYYFHHH